MIINIDDPMVGGPDWMRDTLTATAELAFDENQPRVPAGSSDGGRWGGGSGGGQYKGAAAAETERVAKAARRGVNQSKFDGPVMHRGLAINVSDDLKRRIDTQMYSGAEPDEFNQHLQLGPIIADQLLGFEGHQRIESLSGLGQSWTTREGVAESVNAGRGMNLVVKVTARARQSDILVQEVDTPDGRTAFVDADGNSVDRNRQGSMVGGEMEVCVDGRTPVDIIDVQVKVGGHWESVWGQDSDGFGAGAEELYRRYPSLRDELGIAVFRFDPNQPRNSVGRWETINEIDSRGGIDPKWLSPEAAEEYWRRKSAGRRDGPVDWEEDGDEMAASVEVFHLQGQHDQQSHGRRGGAGSGSATIVDLGDIDDGELVFAASQSLPSGAWPGRHETATSKLYAASSEDPEFTDAHHAYRGGISHQMNTYLRTGEIPPLQPLSAAHGPATWVMVEADGTLIPVDFRRKDVVHRALTPEEAGPFNQRIEAERQARAADSLPGRVQALTEGIDKYGQTAPEYVYRGQAASASGWPEFQMRVGDEFESPGFMSTTQEKRIVQDFARNPIVGDPDTRRVVMSVKTNGAKALPIMAQGSMVDDGIDEREWVMPPETRYRVVNVTDYVAGGVTVRAIETEVIQ